MFTGIVTDVGEVLSVGPQAEGLRRLKIGTAYDPKTIAIGASIACSGVGVSSNPMVIQIVWPCSTGTRLVWALTLKDALVTSPSA